MRRALAAGTLVPGAGLDLAGGRPAGARARVRAGRRGLLSDGAELARLRTCDACCWLFLDHSRGGSRRWCSMADCGTEAKKRRYVAARRARRAGR